MVADAMIDSVSIAINAEQTVAVGAEAPVGFLPVREIIRPRSWHIHDAAVGAFRGFMLPSSLAGWHGFTIRIEQTSAFTAGLPSKLY